MGNIQQERHRLHAQTHMHKLAHTQAGGSVMQRDHLSTRSFFDSQICGCASMPPTLVWVDLYTPTKYLFVSLHALQLDNLPENSPINIVQTPIPITTSVPKRAKSQRKKALAAALATAQEYSEISMEQKKLQV